MAFVPYDYEGELPDDFWYNIIDEPVEFNGQEGWSVNYPDDNRNGYADFYDAWMENPDIELRPSQGHAGT